MHSQDQINRDQGEAQRTASVRLPNLRKGVQIAGLFVGDIHLSTNAPISRAEKKSWQDVQNRVLGELRALQEAYDCPVFIAGDLFDRWDTDAHTINHALVNLPKKCYGIPGNHDLPNHLYTQSFRSAYWTLVEAGKLQNLTPSTGGVQWTVDHLLVSPFPCGFSVMPPKDRHGLCLNVAIIHDYIWTEKTGRTGAPPSHRYAKWMKKLAGYDVAVFGDNHKGFLIQKEGKCSVLNCGTLLRRKSDEIGYTPSVGLLHAEGQITRHFLDVTRDQFTDESKEIAAIEKSLDVDLCGFVEDMAEARKQGGSNWKEMVHLWIKKNKLDKEVEKIIVRCVEAA